MSQTLELHPSSAVRTSPDPAEERAAILANPGFGKHFTDHMVGWITPGPGGKAAGTTRG